MVDPMEVDLTEEELQVVESYQALLKSGMTPAEAALNVSSAGYNFTPRVHQELNRIIKNLENPEAAGP